MRFIWLRIGVLMLAQFFLLCAQKRRPIPDARQPTKKQKLTTNYGLYPSRALFLILLSVLRCSFICWSVIAFLRPRWRNCIFRILPEDRLVPTKEGYTFLKKKSSASASFLETGLSLCATLQHR